MSNSVADNDEYPCPACGFLTFNQPAGSYDICPLCDWQDDEIQLRYPLMRGGANTNSLFEHQLKFLKDIYPSVNEMKGFKRDSNWRPLTKEDCENSNGMPLTPKGYFDSLTGAVNYYWNK